MVMEQQFLVCCYACHIAPSLYSFTNTYTIKQKREMKLSHSPKDTLCWIHTYISNLPQIFRPFRQYATLLPPYSHTYIYTIKYILISVVTEPLPSYQQFHIVGFRGYKSCTRCLATTRLERTYFLRCFGPLGRMLHFSLLKLFLIQSGKRGK
jgi:hypothetical protein